MAYQQIQGLNLGLVLPPSFPKPGSDWEIEVGQFSVKGRKTHFYYHLKRPVLDGEKTSGLVVMHGFGEHGGRYFHFPEYLRSDVSEYVIIDQEGHGRSPGPRGDMKNRERFFSDLDSTLQEAREALTTEHRGLFAHSFGALVCLELMRQKPQGLGFDFYAISAPYLLLKLHVPVLKRLGAHVLNQIWSGLSLSSEFDQTVLSRDESVIETLKKDRLNHTRMTPRMFASIEVLQVELFLEAVKCDAPIAFFVPLQDPLVDAKAAEKFFQENLHSSQKQWFSFSEGRHELMNDLNRDDFFKQLQAWIHQQSVT